MSDPVRPAALLPGDVPSRWRVWRSWLLRTFPGRALVLGGVIKAITWPLGFVSTLPPALDAIDMVGSLALLFAIAYGLTRFAVWAKRRLLWRVRRKLILSYVFVGVVPALLVITFFLLAGLDPRVQRQLVPGAVARPEPDRPGALPGADGAARSAARDHAGRAARKRSSAASRASSRAIRSCRSRWCRCRTCRARSNRHKRRACRRRCRRRCRSPPAAGAHLPRAHRAAEVGGLRRLQRADRLQRAVEAGEPRAISDRRAW